MNPGTISLVRHSWQQARGLGPQVGALFYQQLFAADPTLRPLFRGDMDQQSTRLLQMIGAKSVLATLTAMEVVAPLLPAEGVVGPVVLLGVTGPVAAGRGPVAAVEVRLQKSADANLAS